MLKAYSADNAAEHAAYQSRKYGIGTVGVIFQKIKGKLLQPKERKRIYGGENKGFYSIFFADEQKGRNTQRGVYNKRHIAYAEACFILYHGCNAVESGRCKVVFNNKNIVVCCQQQRHKNNDDVRKNLLKKVFHINRLPNCSAHNRQYTTSISICKANDLRRYNKKY